MRYSNSLSVYADGHRIKIVDVRMDWPQTTHTYALQQQQRNPVSLTSVHISIGPTVGLLTLVLNGSIVYRRLASSICLFIILSET